MGEFTGERVIPGEVDANLLNEHLARYAFAARLARSRRVLDAGCGAGYGCAELAQSATLVVGVDVAREAVEYAREHYQLPNVQFEQGSCTALQWPDGSFDLVVAFEVIEHLSEWRELLVEVRRVLAPDGQFVVSTPNKLYYSETRGHAGPNPYHVHEFDYDEFRAALESVFPAVSLYLENHTEAILFQPVATGCTSESRVACDQGQPPEESHFFVAVAALKPQPFLPALVYVPSSANLLREREHHIALLEGEIEMKNSWLEKAKHELESRQAELEQANRWAERLDEELSERRARIGQLQTELAALEQENQKKTEWAMASANELQRKCEELARCVDVLHETERTVEERTAWAQKVQRQLDFIVASRWVRLGKRLGAGPILDDR